VGSGIAVPADGEGIFMLIAITCPSFPRLQGKSVFSSSRLKLGEDLRKRQL
jgi:hypothetical protein